MKLTVLGSSSSGNCYIFQSDTEAIVLEAGVNLGKVKQALNFDLSKVNAVLVTHEHGDHSKYAKAFEQIFPLYTSKSVIISKNLKRAKEIDAGRTFEAGKFKIVSFQAEHDVECFSFLIHHPDIGKLLFVTDSSSCDYNFNNLNHIMIEANYSNEVLEKSVENGLHPSVAYRVKGSHMELGTTKEVLLAQNLDKVYNIILLHLSKDNSDPEHFKEVLSKATGKPIQIAEPGMEIKISNKPY